ncbi:hypothetical protein KP509_02G001000 [Ceratopteris richardii]|uniref:Ubiquitin-like domain-containing protein n=1 Tax=Ceratopteris richardii TaxID=49495 RepID=A0A8T2V2R6_CERRI|nr:hypothetical protein KP509_02G001000 [Ceratopteris richardii]
MLVTVTSRSGKEVVKGGIQLSENATVKDLKASIHKRTGKLYPESRSRTPSFWAATMLVTVTSRSGKEVVKGGIQLSENVSS